MSFEEFQNSARLYVIGALEPDELQDFEAARKQYGTAAEDFINQCYSLHEAFALSLKPAKASAAIKERLMSMVRERSERQSGSSPK
ncbi:MAG TPA: hypothetical protein VNX27_06195 [Chthoniobacterales bacterium]|jgi:hypothetical protein|nr:hypothetical protein [Chthoniobacterales bacterium]